MADPLVPGPFWMIGCGNMAGAMLEGWLAAGLDPGRVTVIRPSGRPVAPGVRVVAGLPEGPPPALALLGMKPHQLDAVAAGLAPRLGPATILFSILAGAQQQSHRDRFPDVRAVIRAMPNLPVRLNKGVVALHSDSEDAEARDLADHLMGALGHVEWIEDEDLFNVVTALAGSGPAFLFRFMDALAGAAGTLGLPPAQALRLATATVEGSAALAAASGEPPSRLADRVASPGGSTRAGLDVLDADGALSTLLRHTLEASRRRSLEMAEAARPPR